MPIRMMSRLSEIKEWYRKKHSHPPVENEPCKNCGKVFSGHYCPECGQSEKEVNRPFSIVFYDFLGNIFAFDTRFWKTFINVLFRPGFLTKEFFAGRRVRYAPPMRFFIFASFVLFLLLQIYANRGLNAVMYSSFSDSNNPIHLDSASLNLADSVLVSAQSEIKEETGFGLIKSDSISSDSMDVKFDFGTFNNARNLNDLLGILAASLEKKLENETVPHKRKKLIEHINLARSPQQAISKILKYMSWTFFLLLPVFALILKLFYIRKKHYYIQHLIFSIHLHSFIFVVFIFLIVLFGWTNLPMQLITTFTLLILPVYFIIALKRFYGQSFGKVILKFLGISFTYNVVFWVAVTVVFLNALSII